MTIYYQSIAHKLEPVITVEKKFINFAYKSFSGQLNSICQNLRIDLLKFLAGSVSGSPRQASYKGAEIGQLINVRAGRGN